MVFQSFLWSVWLWDLFHQKVNFIAIIGDKEVDNQQVAIRVLGSKDQEVLDLEEFIKKIKISCRIG